MKYVPLTLKEINKKESTSGLKAVSTFSGAGGSCMGLKLAGFDVLWANEFIPAAQDTYKLNHPNTFLDKRDIRGISPKDILDKTGLKKGELDLFEGSPPCSPFSQAKQRGHTGWNQMKNYSDTQQKCDDLFIEYARILKGLQPKMFISENVNALTNSRNRTMFNTVVSHLQHAGYNVMACVLNAKDYGVPQKRKRLFFMGTRKDLGILPSFPNSLNTHFILKDAIPDYLNRRYEELDVNPNSKMYLVLKQAQKKHYRSFEKAHKDLYGTGSMFTHLILYYNQIPSTIIAAPSFYHQLYPRNISIDEVKRIQTFPDDFELTGSYAQQWERIGRSVPPKLMEQIALHIRTILEGI